MVGAWCFGYCQAHEGLPVGFRLLRWFCLLLGLCLFFISFLYLELCSGRWCIDKLKGLLCKPNIYVSWSTSELRVRLAPWYLFEHSGVLFYWPFQGGTSFVDHSGYFWLVFVVLSCVSVYWCLVITCWERADLLALVCGVWLWVCYFPIGILGQVWYLIVSITFLLMICRTNTH